MTANEETTRLSSVKKPRDDNVVGKDSCSVSNTDVGPSTSVPACAKNGWAGRDTDKDVVRQIMWDRLVQGGWNIGPTHHCIPNFVGADVAAWRLSQTEAWHRARTVKCNPDPPQYSVRLRALYDGKILYAPVPYLTRDFPYLRLDPVQLQQQGITFELAATSQGFVTHGQRIDFYGVAEGHLDFCVVGSVAVSRDGGRTGKGAGFADLETGIFRELGVIDEQSVMATTVHSCQLVQEGEQGDPPIVMRSHDSPLDLIATEQELVVVADNNDQKQPRPRGIAWEQVREDQFESIPFLRALRDKMTQTAMNTSKLAT